MSDIDTDDGLNRRRVHADGCNGALGGFADRIVQLELDVLHNLDCQLALVTVHKE